MIMVYLTHEVQDKCGREAQWWDSYVVERNLHVTISLSLVKGRCTIVNFHVEYYDWASGHRTKFCKLKDIAGTISLVEHRS